MTACVSKVRYSMLHLFPFFIVTRSHTQYVGCYIYMLTTAWVLQNTESTDTLFNDISMLCVWRYVTAPGIRVCVPHSRCWCVSMAIYAFVFGYWLYPDSTKTKECNMCKPCAKDNIIIQAKHILLNVDQIWLGVQEFKREGSDKPRS